MPKELTKCEAARLHDEAGAMTAAEIRRIGEAYGMAWVSSLRKPELVKAFRRALERRMTAADD